MVTLSGSVQIHFQIPTWQGIRRMFRYHKLNVVHRSRDPHGAAFSFALGIFLGLMPISVFATMLALFVPRRLGMRTLPAVIGTFFSNWITAPFILAAAGMMGQFLTTGHIAGFKAMLPPPDLGWRESLSFFFYQGWAFLLGITVVSLIGGLVAYAIIYWSVKGALGLRKAKLMERMRTHIHLPHLPHLHRKHADHADGTHSAPNKPASP